MKKHIHFSVFFIGMIALSLGGRVVWADGLSAEEAATRKTSIDAPPPPLLQAKELIALPPEKEASAPEIAAPETPDPWLMISRGMILLKSEGDGEIVAAEDPKQLLGLHDIVYLHARQDAFSPEDELVVYRINRPVFHPENKSFLGDLVQILGVVRVKTVGNNVTTAEIVLSNNAISQQDKIAYIDRFVLPSSGPVISPEAGLEAMIIEVSGNRVNQAQHDIVYIDRGRDEGIAPGDQFIVIHGGERQGAFEVDPSRKEGLHLPYREIGTMVVLAIQEHTATAKITRSLETISKGDAILYLGEE